MLVEVERQTGSRKFDSVDIGDGAKTYGPIGTTYRISVVPLTSCLVICETSLDLFWRTMVPSLGWFSFNFTYLYQFGLSALMTFRVSGPISFSSQMTCGPAHRARKLN